MARCETWHKSSTNIIIIINVVVVVVVVVEAFITYLNVQFNSCKTTVVAVANLLSFSSTTFTVHPNGLTIFSSLL